MTYCGTYAMSENQITSSESGNETIFSATSTDLKRMQRVLGHRLLNIASGIKAASGLLSQMLDDRMTPREREYFPLIINQCEEVCQIVDRMRLFFYDPPAIHLLPVQVAFDVALDAVRSAIPGIELLCEKDLGDCTLRVCALTLRTALEEAVRNARQSSSDPIIIDVSVNDAKELVLRVIDWGEGFSEEAAEMAFEMFYTTQSRAMGLGLSIAGKLVSAQGGRVSLGKEGRDNYVEFVLPLKEGISEIV